MAKPFNGVLPINERCTDKQKYMDAYLKRKQDCRIFHKQAKLECTRILDDGRATAIVLGNTMYGNKKATENSLWVDVLDVNGDSDQFWDFLGRN